MRNKLIFSLLLNIIFHSFHLDRSIDNRTEIIISFLLKVGVVLVEYHVLRVRLMKKLNQHGQWYDKVPSDVNDAAKVAVFEFYKEFRKLQPTRRPEKQTQGDYLSYLAYFTNLYDAFENNRYTDVCYELEKIMFKTSFLQPHIYYNIMKVIDSYLRG